MEETEGEIYEVEATNLFDATSGNRVFKLSLGDTPSYVTILQTQDSNTSETEPNTTILESELEDSDLIEFFIEEPKTTSDSKTTKRSSKKSFVCPESGCEKAFPSIRQLKDHTKVHSESCRSIFSCPYEGCNKRLSSCYSQKAHIRTHTGEKPYPCKFCGKSFKMSGDLLKHKRIHTGEKPFPCPYEGCNRSFTTSNIRSVHLRTHTGERPFTCTYEGCERTFASTTNFKNHLRIHSGEKPYMCRVPMCMKRFTEYSSLYKHQLVHSNLKRFICSVCHKQYRQKATLNTHRKTVHGLTGENDLEIFLAETGENVAGEIVLGNLEDHFLTSTVENCEVIEAEIVNEMLIDGVGVVNLGYLKPPN